MRGRFSAELWLPWTVFALIAGAVLSPLWPDLLLSGFSGVLHWVKLAHEESVSLSTYGKWWIGKPHHFLSDGLSGDATLFYNYLSDSLLNLLARATGLPAMAAQVLLYGPALFFLLPALAYLSLRPILKHWPTAFFASLIITLGTSSRVMALWDPARDDLLHRVLHVPFHSVGLANAQALAWVLFTPTIACLYLAHVRRSRGYSILSGLLLGIFFHVHTLTFIQAAAIHVFYLCFRNAEGRKNWLNLTMAPFFLWMIASLVVGSTGLLALAATLGVMLLMNFAVSRDKSLYLWSYATTAIVALPYALVLAKNLGALANEGKISGNAVTELELFSYFAFYALAAYWAIRLLWKSDRELGRWLLAWVVCLFILGHNDKWGWGNHPYRFLINLIFPLAILTAIAAFHHPRAWVRNALIGVFTFMLACNWVALVRNYRIYLNYLIPTAESAQFLEQVRSETATAAARSIEPVTFVAPPEFSYPIGMVQASVLVNASEIPGIVPDYRYQLSPELYLDRMAIFCFAFPDYPHFDAHTERRLCAKPDPAMPLREPALRALSLELKRVRIAAAYGAPFSETLTPAAALYGWPKLSGEVNFTRLYQVSAPRFEGVATLLESRTDAGITRARLSLGSEKSEDRWVTVAASRNLRRDLKALRVGDALLSSRFLSDQWLVSDPIAGIPSETSLTFEWVDSLRVIPRDPLYFLALIRERDLDRYLRQPR